MEIYSENDSFVWIPVSQMTKTYPPRAFLPVKGLEEEYGYGYKAKRCSGIVIIFIGYLSWFNFKLS